ncbi:MAG: DUF4350 domain-containing protein [Pseudomonadota bacterium]
MTLSRGQLFALLLCGGVIALAGWWWVENMEQRLGPVATGTDAARKNPMLAATRLLQRHGHQVTLAPTLGTLALAALPDGTLLLAEPEGVVNAGQARQLLAWVRRGNTLITRPRRLNPDEDASAGSPAKATASAPRLSGKVEVDPLAVHLGVRSSEGQQQLGRCAPGSAALKDDKQAPWLLAGMRLACLALPASGHLLEVDTRSAILVTLRGAAEPAWSDSKGEAVRLYPEGKGRIVMLAANYFGNQRLQHFDHAELLLALSAYDARRTDVTIVQRIDVLRWYAALWQNYSMALSGAALALVLLVWKSMRRFGPLLPAPQRERRALIEHIDASGAWLWQFPGGRELLLGAVRDSVLALLERRQPELRALGPGDQLALMARLTGLPLGALDAALFQPALRRPQEFTRQIRTLQQLRNHYER